MSKALKTERQLTFIDDCPREAKHAKEKLNVCIAETIEPQYGSYLWACSVVLAQFIFHHREDIFKRKTILEIGAGTALPSIVAIKSSKPNCVVITDKTCSARSSLYQNQIFQYVDFFSTKNPSSDEEPPEKRNMINSSENRHTRTCDDVSLYCNVFLMPLMWGDLLPYLFDLEKNCRCLPDTIIAADCFYDPSLFEQVISTIYYLLRSHFERTKEKSAKCFCSYQTRSIEWSIADMLSPWSLECIHIPLSSFNADTFDIANSGMPGSHTIQMMEITLK